MKVPPIGDVLPRVDWPAPSLRIIVMENVVITEYTIDFRGLRSDQARCTGTFTADAHRGGFLASFIDPILRDIPVPRFTRIRQANGGIEGSFDFVWLTKPPS